MSYQGETLSAKEQEDMFDCTDENKIGFHVAKQLCKKLGGDLMVRSSDGETHFDFYVAVKLPIDSTLSL